LSTVPVRANSFSNRTPDDRVGRDLEAVHEVHRRDRASRRAASTL
jgi:hypothetical protein